MYTVIVHSNTVIKDRLKLIKNRYLLFCSKNLLFGQSYALVGAKKKKTVVNCALNNFDVIKCFPI